MKKYLACLLGMGLAFATQLRADTTVTNNSVEAFEAALENTITAGGGTITITQPIVIGSTNGSDDRSFDGESTVIISGGNASSLFLVQNGSLALANFTLQNGSSTNGGAIYIAADGALTLTNCTFSNNVARGPDGDSADTDGSNGRVTGGNGKKGSAGFPAFGGAIYNLGDLSILNCNFLTNSVIGGSGGDGSNGGTGGSRGGNGGAGGNGAGAFGGAIYSVGTFSMEDTTLAGNFAQGGTGGLGGAGGSGGINSGTAGSGGIGGAAGGAGLYVLNKTATNMIFNCTFSANIAQGGDSADGGVASTGIGQAGRPGGGALGGGIDNAGALALTNATFFQNSAVGGAGGNGGSGGRGGNGGTGGNAVGGGIYNTGMVFVVNCSLSKNIAAGGTNGAPGSGVAGGKNGKKGSSSGGNIASVVSKKKGQFFLMNSILASTTSGGASSGTIVDGGHNLSADKTIKFSKKGTSKANINPQIGDLADNTGPTKTLAISTNSPAVDQLDPADAPEIDQRHVIRPKVVFSALSDIGAFELDTSILTILRQPQSTNVVRGSNATFSVTAQGPGPLFYQWFFNNTAVQSLTNSSFTITNVQLTNAGNFQVVVSNSFTSVTSDVAVLSVTLITNTPPVITQQPASTTVLVGATATFTAAAIGTSPLYYQWQLQLSSTNFAIISGATNTTLSITNVQLTNAGNYRVVVTNNFGTTNSTLAALFVTTNSSTGITLPEAVTSSLQRQPLVVPLAGSDSESPQSVNFTFSTTADARYVIEYKTSLSDPVWIPIATNIGNGDWLTNKIPVTNGPSGFYRVRSQ